MVGGEVVSQLGRRRFTSLPDNHGSTIRFNPGQVEVDVVYLERRTSVRHEHVGEVDIPVVKYELLRRGGPRVGRDAPMTDSQGVEESESLRRKGE